MMIHPTAIIDPSAQIPESTKVEHYVTIGANVILGENNIIHHNAVIEANCTIGDNNQFFPYSIIGHSAQDINYIDPEKSKNTKLSIGNNNIFRELVTIHRGTFKHGYDGTTYIGNNNLLLTMSHVAHDVRVHNNVILSGASIAGHAILEDHCIAGIRTAVHQFCRIGKHSILSGKSFVSADIPPFAICGNQNNIRGVNQIGLQRHEIPEETINVIIQAFNYLKSPKILYKQAIEKITTEFGSYAEIQYLLNFLANSQRKAQLKKLD